MISIHAPRVGSDIKGCGDFLCFGTISIHAPRVGSDDLSLIDTLPDRDISIHAPRVGSDKNESGERTAPQHFNPRSPCGERPNRNG